MPSSKRRADNLQKNLPEIQRNAIIDLLLWVCIYGTEIFLEFLVCIIFASF